MSNSIDPDETAHCEPSHLDLCCLQKLINMAYGSERVNSLPYLNRKKKNDREQIDFTTY